MEFINSHNFFNNNRKYFKFTICLLIVSIITIIFYRSSGAINIISFLKETKNILTPFIYGIGIAYLLNPILKFIENKLLLKSKYISNRKSLKRFISVGVTFLILFSFLIWFFRYIIPEIVNNVQDISAKLKALDVSILESNLAKLQMSLKKYIPLSDNVWESSFIKLNEFIAMAVNNIPNILNKVISGTVTIASTLLSTIFNIIVGIVISIYILIDKENIGSFSKKIIYSFFTSNFAKKTLNFAKETNDTFEKFFVGKVIDSIIIGILFFIGVIIINTPSKILLSIIIGVTNMIPFFGPFIGGIPVILITLVTDITHPMKSLWILVLILVLQQFDGNILGPKILGDSIGIKPLGIIFAIIVSGALFGAAGMFFGVPVFAVIFNTFSKYIEKKYNFKLEE